MINSSGVTKSINEMNAFFRYISPGAFTIKLFTAIIYGLFVIS
jgi:hypothetical protein